MLETCKNLHMRNPYPKDTQCREGAKAEMRAPVVPSNEDTMIIFADPNLSTNQPFTRATTIKVMYHIKITFSIYISLHLQIKEKEFNTPQKKKFLLSLDCLTHLVLLNIFFKVNEI